LVIWNDGSWLAITSGEEVICKLTMKGVKELFKRCPEVRKRSIDRTLMAKVLEAVGEFDDE